MFLITGLGIILLWDAYFFINYLISFLHNYRIKDWSPRVSVLIPAYNEERNIVGAIKSALNQGYPSFEVIVIDDGSEDGTFKRAVSIRDGRLRVFRKRHEGKAKALNFGLKNSRGEIIVTTDADGILDKNAIRELVRRFYSKEVVAVGGQVRVAGRSFLARAQDIEHLRIAMFRRARELDDLSLAPGPVSAFRRSALEAIGGFAEDAVEDFATTKAVKKYGKVVYAPGARVYVEMPNSLRKLWEQRKRWFLGDLQHIGGGFMKDWLFLILGDAVALLDVLIPPATLLYAPELFVIWYAAEALSMLVPTLIEGGSILDVLVFPLFLWFWAVFYLSIHLYGYIRRIPC